MKFNYSKTLLATLFCALFFPFLGLTQSDVSEKLVLHYSEKLPIDDDKSQPNRRDPSDIIKVGDTWHMWYSRMKSDERSGYDASIWHATSTDNGKSWKEQSEAIPRGKGNSWDATSAFTPNILFFEGKYYLYYTGAGIKFRRKDSKVYIGMAYSDSPFGPWIKHEGNPILEPSKAINKFDSFRIDDACLAVRKGKIWLYYKGRQQGKNPSTTKMGVAVAEKPFGPYIRQNSGNPVQPGGHEVCIWMDDKEGIYSVVNHNGPKDLINTIQYAEDGINFSKVADIEAYFQGEKALIKASGLYRHELKAPVTGGFPSWGIAGTRELQYIDVKITEH